MKKFLSALLLASFTFFSVQSQEGIIGVKGGLNFSTFSGAEAGDLSRRVSFNVGVMLESKLSNTISLQPEILFSSQGAKQKLGATDLQNRLNYLNLPILLKFYLSKGFSIDAGPQLGILVSAKQSSTSTNDTDIKTFFGDTDYGLVLGSSYKFENRLNLSVRYGFGLKNIINTNTFNNSSSLKNGVLQLSIGYYFNNKRK